MSGRYKTMELKVYLSKVVQDLNKLQLRPAKEYTTLEFCLFYLLLLKEE